MNIIKVIEGIINKKNISNIPADLVCRCCDETFTEAQIVGGLLPIHFDNSVEECAGSSTLLVRVSLKTVAPVGME